MFTIAYILRNHFKMFTPRKQASPNIVHVGLAKQHSITSRLMVVSRAAK